MSGPGVPLVEDVWDVKFLRKALRELKGCVSATLLSLYLGWGFEEEELERGRHLKRSLDSMNAMPRNSETIKGVRIGAVIEMLVIFPETFSSLIWFCDVWQCRKVREDFAVRPKLNSHSRQ
jgi:hypothetical protein